MVLPSYEEINISESNGDIYKKIKFDKITVIIYGTAKHSRTELRYSINKGCKRKNVDLSKYMSAINDYFISHPVYKKIMTEL